MKMRNTLFFLLAILMSAFPVLAQEKPMVKMDLETFSQRNALHGPAYNGRDYFEGFEFGNVPPAGWTAGVLNPDYTWGINAAPGFVGALEGDFVAYCPWQTPDLQDESISFDQYVDVAAGEYVLSFFMAGALGTDWDLNVAETVEVNGTTVFDFDSNVSQYFIWEKFFVDLSAYNNQAVTITFRYQGQDGDIHLLDAVMVDDGTGWDPNPPEQILNDTCEGAVANGFELMPGAFSYLTDNTLANADYPLTTSDCTGYSAGGQDVVYVVCLDQGEMLDVSMQCGFDASLYLIDDCADPEGSCLAGSDSTTSEGLEEIIGFVAPYEGMFFIVASAYNIGVGPIEIFGTNYGDGCVVATDATTFGGLKSFYR